jgi:hypothetical protein
VGLGLGNIADISPALVLADDADSKSVSRRLSSQRNEGHPELVEKCAAQLGHADLRLRTQAGITLGKLGGKASFGAFVRDAAAELRLPWLRHGLVSGLAGTQDSDILLKVAQSNRGAEAVFATLALARQRSPLLSAAA